MIGDTCVALGPDCECKVTIAQCLICRGATVGRNACSRNGVFGTSTVSSFLLALCFRFDDGNGERVTVGDVASN